MQSAKPTAEAIFDLSSLSNDIHKVIVDDNFLADPRFKDYLSQPKYKDLNIAEKRAVMFMKLAKLRGLEKNIDNQGTSLVILAAKHGRTSCLRALRKKADPKSYSGYRENEQGPALFVNHQDNHGFYPVTYAARGNHLEAAIFLCLQGAVLNNFNHPPVEFLQPNTVISAELEAQLKARIQNALANPASAEYKHITRTNYDTALDYAIAEKNICIIALFLEFNATIRTASMQKLAALLQANKSHPLYNDCLAHLNRQKANAPFKRKEWAELKVFLEKLRAHQQVAINFDVARASVDVKQMSSAQVTSVLAKVVNSSKPPVKLLAPLKRRGTTSPRNSAPALPSVPENPSAYASDPQRLANGIYTAGVVHGVFYSSLKAAASSLQPTSGVITSASAPAQPVNNRENVQLPPPVAAF